MRRTLASKIIISLIQHTFVANFYVLFYYIITYIQLEEKIIKRDICNVNHAKIAK